MDKQNKKRKKSYYLKSSQQKRQKLNKLEAGMRGFLVTCNRDEKQAVREMYNVLNEYADIVYGAEQEQTEPKNTDLDDGSEESSDDDMEKAMNKEVKVIQDSQTGPRRFQNCYTNAKNCIFISTTLDDPCDLAHKIFSDLSSSKKQKTRFAMRLLPVAGTCKAYLEDIKKLAEQILSPHFSTPVGDGKTYGIVFRVRNNNGVSRQCVMPMMGQLIVDMNPLNRVHLNNPDLVVLVEIVCSVCCMSVVKDFYKFRKYNFHEVIKDSGSETDKMHTKVGVSGNEKEKLSTQIGESGNGPDKMSTQVGDSANEKNTLSTQVGDSENGPDHNSTQAEDSGNGTDKKSTQVEELKTLAENAVQNKKADISQTVNFSETQTNIGGKDSTVTEITVDSLKVEKSSLSKEGLCGQSDCENLDKNLNSTSSDCSKKIIPAIENDSCTEMVTS
ncbi:THUMP domain-containing protein 1-like [Gigantopelta aegis]|uniref:THUMP domain-containing protein 1-like n=1 Tax=Gigantopelta aegis TaxID=1735272 RepID=UPI001B88DBBA|nr:THUMP domain-containing protein 1-like [Gigantopelta aegis]